MFNITSMRIAERQNGKNVFVKFLPYGLPTLEMVSEDLPAPDSWEETPVTEDGQEAVVRSPIYKDSRLQYLQDALTQRMQGLARSRDKSGQLPCQTWEEVEESGGGGIKYPVLLKEFREKLVSWLETATQLGEKQRAAVMAYTDTRTLAAADTHKKERMGDLLGQFVEGLGDEAATYGSVVTSLNRALATDLDEVDF